MQNSKWARFVPTTTIGREGRRIYAKRGRRRREKRKVQLRCKKLEPSLAPFELQIGESTRRLYTTTYYGATIVARCRGKNLT